MFLAVQVRVRGRGDGGSDDDNSDAVRAPSKHSVGLLHPPSAKAVVARRSTLDRRRREQPCSSRDGREPARGAARSSRAVCHPPSIAAKGARGGKPDVSEASHRQTQAVVQRRGRPIERHPERCREALGRRALGRPAAREMRGGRRQAKGGGAVRKPTARRGRADVPPRVPCACGGKEVGGAPHATDAREE